MKKYITVFFFIFISVMSFCVSLTLSVSDFEVNSDNPKYKYIGKGISEVVVVSLNQNRNLVVVERHKRTELLQELELSLSDMADPALQIRVGRLLAATHLVFGELVDMGDEMLLSIRVVEVETGKTVWSGTESFRIARYERVAKRISSKITMGVTGAEIEQIAEVKEEIEEESEEALIHFSKAIDYYDKGEKNSAVEELKKAKIENPKSKAIQLYIYKLSEFAPKFQIELSTHMATYNPASLAFIDSDSIDFWCSGALPLLHGYQVSIGGGIEAQQDCVSARIGYSFPFGSRWGASFEFRWTDPIQKEYLPYNISYQGLVTDKFIATNDLFDLSGAVGFAVTDRFSIGGQSSFGYVFRCNDNPPDQFVETGPVGTVGFGFIYKLTSTLTFDCSSSATTKKEVYLVLDEKTADVGQLPLLFDASLVYTFWDGKAFASFKSITDIYFDDRGGHSLRLVPAVEFWPIIFFALRAGYQYSHHFQDDDISIGHGGIFGLSLRIKKWEINTNLSLNMNPLHVIPGYVIRNDVIILLGVSYSPGFLERN